MQNQNVWVIKKLVYSDRREDANKVRNRMCTCNFSIKSENLQFRRETSSYVAHANVNLKRK